MLAPLFGAFSLSLFYVTLLSLIKRSCRQWLYKQTPNTNSLWGGKGGGGGCRRERALWCVSLSLSLTHLYRVPSFVRLGLLCLGEREREWKERKEGKVAAFPFICEQTRPGPQYVHMLDGPNICSILASSGRFKRPAGKPNRSEHMCIYMSKEENKEKARGGKGETRGRQRWGTEKFQTF